MYSLSFKTLYGEITFECFLAGSKISLAAGLTFGSVAGYGAYCVTRDPKNVKISLCKCFTPVKKKKKEVTEVPVIESCDHV